MNPPPHSMFDPTTRQKASSSQPSQGAINRRLSQANPGQDPKPLPSDPQIPALVHTLPNGAGNQSSWVLLLPWKYVLPVWYAMMYHPLATGGTVCFGGLQEHHQIAFESGRPWFPADYPGTEAGKQWEEREAAKAKSEWLRKPKGRRLEYESIDLGLGRKGEIGRGWCCDWEVFQRPEVGQTLAHLSRLSASKVLEGVT